jgi:hypothetical protein
MLGGCTGGSILGGDDTAEAVMLVREANKELSKVRDLYRKNEEKREQLKNALDAEDEDEVKKIAQDAIHVINEGFEYGTTGVDKLRDAQDLDINDDFKTYLSLKEQALRLQMEAFENYRQAARMLRDHYEPKNVQQKERVKKDFEERNDKYRVLMERARNVSSEANELYRDTIRKQR